MERKSERTRASRSGIKILNVETLKAKPLRSVVTSESMSPPKQFKMSIAKSKSEIIQQKKMDHYVLHTVKGEADTEGYNGENIDFIYTDNQGEEIFGGESGEITETLHLSGNEDDENEHEMNDIRTEEIVEHVCGKCFRSFKRFNALKKHLDFCRYDSKYHLRKAEMLKNVEKIEKDAIIMENKDICFCCGESYDTFHLGHINCPDCPKSFKTQSSYERHIFITHSEFMDFPCTICNAKLRSENFLKLHIEQHQNRGKPWACKICGKDFTRSYHLKRHQKYSACSADINDAMNCKVCNRVFYRLDNLRAHLKQHLGTHSAKKSEYMCPICKNCFYSLSTLNIHTRTHTGERPFECDLCDKKFPSLVALKKHRRYHTGEKPYTCTVCGQTFAVKEVLNRHMKRHTGERPHVCQECGKSFIQGTQLRNHLRTHLRPFECGNCLEKFKTQKQLDRHAKIHKVKKVKGKTKKGEHVCSLCNKICKNKEELKRHTDKHNGIITKKRATRTDCAICEKNFDTVKNLEFHILKVHEVDPEEFINEKRMQEQDAPPATEIIKLEEAEGVEILDERFNFIPSKLNINDATTTTDGDGTVIVQEFYLDELPTTSSSKQTIFLNKDAFTVIPLDAAESIMAGSEDTFTIQALPKEASPKQTSPKRVSSKRASPKDGSAEKASPSAKICLRKSLAESLAAAIADDEDDDINIEVASTEDEKIKENVSKLLDMLVDKVTLKRFGWPENSVENVLCQVIENCGHELSKDADTYINCDFSTRMREYVKLLFTVVIHNDSIKELLNNYPIDEVIEYVLGNDEDDDEEDNDEDNGDMRNEQRNGNGIEA